MSAFDMTDFWLTNP